MWNSSEGLKPCRAHAFINLGQWVSRHHTRTWMLAVHQHRASANWVDVNSLVQPVAASVWFACASESAGEAEPEESDAVGKVAGHPHADCCGQSDMLRVPHLKHTKHASNTYTVL